MKVLIPIPIHQAGVEYLTERGYEVCTCDPQNKDEIKKGFAECNAAIIRATVIDKDILSAANGKLKIIARHGVGCDNVDLDEATKKHIQVTNTPTSSTRAVAEHAVALMLACGHLMKESDSAVANGNWGPFKKNISTQLGDSTVGLIGLGRIGNEVAKIVMHGFGAKVVAYDKYAKSGLEGVELLPSVDDVLKRADFISVHMPLTEENRGSIGGEFFRKMKKGSFFVNTSRGEIVDQDALIKAVNEKHLGGAGLDVMYPEPLPVNHPLADNPRIVLTPHYATITETTLARLAVDSAKCVDAVLSGKELLWPVNRLE